MIAEASRKASIEDAQIRAFASLPDADLCGPTPRPRRLQPSFYFSIMAFCLPSTCLTVSVFILSLVSSFSSTLPPMSPSWPDIRSGIFLNLRPRPGFCTSVMPRLRLRQLSQCDVSMQKPIRLCRVSFGHTLDNPCITNWVAQHLIENPICLKNIGGPSTVMISELW